MADESGEWESAMKPALANRLSSPSYTLILLTLMNILYLLDRNAILVTAESIKVEFRLSDTELGLITGLIYGGAYAAAGLPIGLLIDRSCRTKLLAVLVVVWSGATFLCGFVGRFWQLAAARMVVGAAESGGGPAAMSLLTAIYPAERRASVASIFYAGAGVGGIISFLVGGYVAQQWGWRAVFMLYGAPGIVLALVIWLTVREPARQIEEAKSPQHSIWRTVATLVGERSLFATYAGSILFTLSIASVGGWIVPFLIRVHGMPLASASVVAGLGLGLLATIGGIGFGHLSDRKEQFRDGGAMRLLALGSLFNGAAAIGLALAPDMVTAVACFAAWGLSALIYSGPVNASISRQAPPWALGIAFALFAILANLLGQGLGPILTGAVSDLLAPRWGENSLRPALAMAGVVQIPAAIAFALVCRMGRRAAKVSENGAAATD